MNTVDLVYFESVFRTGSIKHAAKELGVSIATVSRAISSLEGELGYQLFQKDGSKFHIAKNSVDLYQRIVNPLAELNLVSRDISANSSFKVVAPPFLSFKTFSLLRAKFEACFKQQLIIEYSHQITSREKAYTDLRLGHIDLFIDLKPADEYLLKSTLIYSDTLCLFHAKANVTRNSAAAYRRYAKLKWLPSETYLFSEFFGANQPLQAELVLDCYSDYLSTVASTDNLFGVNLNGAIDRQRFDIDADELATDIKLYSIMNNGLMQSSGEQRTWLFKELSSMSDWLFKL